MKKKSPKLIDKFQTQLTSYLSLADQDPHVNPVKLLAYEISREIENGSVNFDDLETVLLDLHELGVRARAKDLRHRSGLNALPEHHAALTKIIRAQAALGFASFKKWSETPALGLVTTAHPTFINSEAVESRILAYTMGDRPKRNLGASEILRETPPSLKDEHRLSQVAIKNMHNAIDDLNRHILSEAQSLFPQKWQTITPDLVHVSTWVGYDLDGRTDISWVDTICLKLTEKRVQLQTYLDTAQFISEQYASKASTNVLDSFIRSLHAACEIAQNEELLFAKDLTDKSRLIQAANTLSEKNPKRWTDTKQPISLLRKAIKNTDSPELIREIISLISKIMRSGMGTAAIQLRVNAQQVLSAISGVLEIAPEDRLDGRTLLAKVNKLAVDSPSVETNFASLDMAENTVNRQLILAKQIISHIDASVPIRFLIAECDQAIVVMSALALAKYYGVNQAIDISPLFETPNALRNGGRVMSQLLDQSAYRSYVKKRKSIAIQTGFSDAGRFMGQIAAVMAIERLQSHVAEAIAQSGLTGVRIIIFNTQGESIGRGGHSGSLSDRMDYIMSPWVFQKFDTYKIPVTHEFSFQGGDGYLWFGSSALSEASLTQLVCSRQADHSAANEDPFYNDSDFVWDFYNEIVTQQDSLYHDTDYRYLLSGFARAFLTPTGSRPEMRQAIGTTEQSTFTPRRIRAIPHNALLQQLSMPLNVIFGIGRAMRIDPSRFTSLFANSKRGQTILSAVSEAWSNTNLQAVTAYGDLQDPNFWISRASQRDANEIDWRFRVVANAFYHSNPNSKIRQLVYRIRADGQNQMAALKTIGIKVNLGLHAKSNREYLQQSLAHALRMTIFMHAQLSAAELPVNAPPGASRQEILEKLCRFQIDEAIEALRSAYPHQTLSSDWESELTAAREDKVAPNLEQIDERVLETLKLCQKLARLSNYIMPLHFSAYG